MFDYDDRQRLANSRFREVYRNLGATRNPSRSRIVAELDRLEITDEATRERVLRDCTQIAEARRDLGGFPARQLADQLTVQLEREIEEADRLIEPKEKPQAAPVTPEMIESIIDPSGAAREAARIVADIPDSTRYVETRRRGRAA